MNPPKTGEGPVTEKDYAHDSFRGDRPIVETVGAVLAIIAQNEDVVLGDTSRAKLCCPDACPGNGKWAAVNEDSAIRSDNVVAPDTDHSFGNDFALMRGIDKSNDPPVEFFSLAHRTRENIVAHTEGWFHARRNNTETLEIAPEK